MWHVHAVTSSCPSVQGNSSFPLLIFIPVFPRKCSLNSAGKYYLFLFSNVLFITFLAAHFMKTPDGNSFRMCHSSYKDMTSSPNFFPSSHSSSKQYFWMVSENPLFFLLPIPPVYPLLLLPITLSLLLNVSFHHQYTTRFPTYIIRTVSFNPQTLWVPTTWIALMNILLSRNFAQTNDVDYAIWTLPEIIVFSKEPTEI